MTPQESQLVAELFDRLARLETTPRDPDAERAIADGARRAPHALYALVQTALVQDEALKLANARIEELQAELDGPPEPAPRQGGFLDSMREAFGGREPRGSVPSVRAQNQSQSYQSQGYPPQGYQSRSQQTQPGYPPPPPGYAGSPAFGGGGSFLGTAASAAAGVIGGALLLDGIRSMFGHHPGGAAFGNLADDRTSPWASGGSAANSDLARQAGIDHVGDHVHDTNDQLSQADALSDADDDEDDMSDDDTDFADSGDSGGDGFDV